MSNQKKDENRRPEWAPEGAGDEFASRVMKGRDGGHDGMSQIRAKSADDSSQPRPRRRTLSVDDYVQGVLDQDRTILARAITLVESNSAAHFDLAQAVLKELLPYTGQSIRVGITGVPGVGKSTFIESLGCHLIEKGHQVAVMAIDPTSSLTRGSILGDKTRMERLSRERNAFIRPSPTGGKLGGVARKSRETVLLCEAAGFDVLLLETVGVGQSETVVRSMVDFFLLLMLAGAGDELQGIKKGIMELADALVINKADGENRLQAKRARAEYNQALHYLAPATEGWQTKAYICSALNDEGIAEIWSVVEDFQEKTKDSGVFTKRRHAQMADWVYAMVEEHLLNRFFNHPQIKHKLPQLQADVIEGKLPATTAVTELLDLYERE